MNAKQEELKDKVEALEIVMQNLSAKDQEFAKSLTDFYKRKATLSPKQEYWVQVLLDRSMNKEKKPEDKQVGNFNGVYALFAKAKQKLKFPKIWLEVKGKPIVLSMAGEKSKNPGIINVTDGGSFGNNRWYGRVQVDGTWTRGMKTYEEQTEVEQLLKAMSRHPAQAAKEYGQITGRCCFCGKHLKDEHSTAAGFGPQCAKQWGLADAWKKATGILDIESLKEAA